jgi:hypothetical protein
MEPIEEMGDAPTPRTEDQMLERNGAKNPTNTERDTVPISPPSSQVSTAATVVAA